MRVVSAELQRTARGLYVTRTIADLEDTDLIDISRITEALQYRKREGDWSEETGTRKRFSPCEEMSLVSPELPVCAGRTYPPGYHLEIRQNPDVFPLRITTHCSPT